MIFRERVGGGGREKSVDVPIDGDGWIGAGIVWLSVAVMAGGGSRRDMPRADSGDPLLPTMSGEEAGVGGVVVRGMLRLEG